MVQLAGQSSYNTSPRSCSLSPSQSGACSSDADGTQSVTSELPPPHRCGMPYAMRDFKAQHLSEQYWLPSRIVDASIGTGIRRGSVSLIHPRIDTACVLTRHSHVPRLYSDTLVGRAKRGGGRGISSSCYGVRVDHEAREAGLCQGLARRALRVFALQVHQRCVVLVGLQEACTIAWHSTLKSCAWAYCSRARKVG